MKKLPYTEYGPPSQIMDKIAEGWFYILLIFMWHPFPKSDTQVHLYYTTKHTVFARNEMGGQYFTKE